MSIIHLTKTFSKPEDERVKSQEVFFDVDYVIFYRKTLFHSGASMIDIQLYSGVLSYHSHDWDKKSWEQCISTLENHFAEPIEASPEDQPSLFIP